MDGSTTSKKPPKVPTDDRSSTNKVTCSDKLDDKLSNKLTADPEFAEIVNAWPELPNDIKSAVLTLVRASTDKQK